MKQLLFIFLLLPFYSIAQLDVGVNGGLVHYKFEMNGQGYQPRNTGNVFDVTASYKFRKIKIGMGLGRYVLPLSLSGIGYVPFDPPPSYYYSNPMTDFFLLLDYEWRFKKSSFFYVGGRGGITSIKKSDYLDADPSAIVNTTGTTPPATGFSYGAHAGCNYKLYRGLCINVQAGVTFIKNTFQGAGDT